MLCAPITSQFAASEALNNGLTHVTKMKDSYKKRRDFIVDRLNKMGLDCHLPGGAFYVFPDISKTGMTSHEFALGLLKQQDVAAVPGDAFGSGGEGFVRCCYATAFEQIEIAMNRMERFLN